MSGSTAKTEEQSRSKFPSPRGDKLCPGIMAAINESMKQFPSPRGDKLCLIAIFEKNLKTFLFPSPRGDKLCLVALRTFAPFSRFRPLAGISCVPMQRGRSTMRKSFRPLAGISCVTIPAKSRRTMRFPSPRGDKLCQSLQHIAPHAVSFRPLAGISCVRRSRQTGSALGRFPSPRGDKLCRH